MHKRARVPGGRVVLFVVFVSRPRATHAHRFHMVFMMRRNVNASSSSTTATPQSRKPEPPPAQQQPPRQKKLSFREPEVVVSPRGGGGGRPRTAAASAQVTARVPASTSVPDCGRTDELGLDDEQLQVMTASPGGSRDTRVVRTVVILSRRSSPLFSNTPFADLIDLFGFVALLLLLS